MKRCFVALCLLTAFLLVSASAQGLPTADELLKMMGDQAVKAKTMQADSVMTMTGPMGPPMKSTGKIYASNTVADGKTVHKSHMTMKMTIEAEGMSMTNEMKNVNDGTFIWHEMRSSMMPVVRVVKTRVGQSMGPQGPQATPEEGVEEMKKQFNFTGVGEDTIDGRKMYVLEGILKSETSKDNPMSGAKYYVDQETMVVRRTVMLDKGGKEIGRFDLTNIKLNEALDPKLFEYTPPPGVQVQDMTGK